MLSVFKQPEVKENNPIASSPSTFPLAQNSLPDSDLQNTLTVSNSATTLETNYEQLRVQKKKARDSVVQQAERMIKRSRVEHVPGNPGDQFLCMIGVVAIQEILWGLY